MFRFAAFRGAILAAAVAMFTGNGAFAEELKIGDAAPAFAVTGIDGQEYSLEDLSKDVDVVVVCFTCSGCPVAQAYEERLIEFNKKYQDKKVAFVAVNSNNATEDLEGMKSRAKDKGYNFLYAFDSSGKAAENYGAKVTPEFFIIHKGKVAYHGAFDDKQKEPTESYVANAVDALLSGSAPKVAETKAFGCGIKKAK